MTFPRASGVLLHPTSLPGRFGIGDLGRDAYDFVDFLIGADQSLWQVLPLGPTGYGDSPYQCFSAFAGNALLVSPQSLLEDGLLTAAELDATPNFPIDRVDFGPLISFKNNLLNRAFRRFQSTPNSPLRGEFEEFASRSAGWLDD